MLTTHKTKPRFVFFFDINGTVILGDNVRGKPLQVAARELLAEQRKHTFCDEQMTYKQFVDKQIPIPAGISCEEEEFLKQARLRDYSEYLPHVDLLYPELVEQVVEDADMIQNAITDMLSQYRQVFDSFYNLVDACKVGEISARIIFRSFGTDTEDVVKEVSRETNRTFTRYKFVGEHLTKTDSSEEPISKNNLLECLQNTAGGDAVWQDDYKHWKQHGFASHSGKPFPLAKSTHASTCVVAVDTFLALTKPMYFVDQVNQIIAQHPEDELIHVFFDDNAHAKQIIHIIDHAQDANA